MLGGSLDHRTSWAQGAGWHSLMLSLCHGWHRSNVRHTIVRDRIQPDTQRSTELISNWWWYNNVMQGMCGDPTDARYSSRMQLCASLTMHYLSLASFSEKIGSGETNECNDGAPLFRLMDCSRGAIFRDSGSVTRQPAIKLPTSNHHFILFGITIEFVFSPGPRIKE